MQPLVSDTMGVINKGNTFEYDPGAETASW